MFKRYLKSEHTDRRTDRRTHGQTDILTYRKHRPRGPMLLKHCLFVFSNAYLLRVFELSYFNSIKLAYQTLPISEHDLEN